MDATGYLNFAKNIFFKLSVNISSKLSLAGDSTKNFFAVVFTIKNIVKENAVLNQKVDELSFETARLESAKEENQALRKALNFKQQSIFKMLPVEVKSFDPTGFTQTVIINAGSADGVSQSSTVIASPGLLVGKVTKVYADFSEVTLITDPVSIVNAKVADSNAQGLIRGQHGLSLLLDLLTQNEVIKPGDKVLTSGLGSDFPSDLLIGEVSAIASIPSQLFQKAYITPAADLRDLQFIFVIK